MKTIKIILTAMLLLITASTLGRTGDGLFLLSNSILAKNKTIKVYNGTNIPIKVAIHNAIIENTIGNPVDKPVIINSERSLIINEKFDLNSFINVVLYREDGLKILIDSRKMERGSDRTQFFNIAEADTKKNTSDKTDLDNMNLFLENQVQEFKNQHIFAIKLSDDASSSIQEYLGAIVIADMSDGIDNKSRMKFTITARQLGINQPFIFKGTDITKTYRFSKEFIFSGGSKFPGMFSADLNYGNSDLVEATYSIYKLGSVLLQSEENISTFDLLDNYQNEVKSDIYGAIAEILSKCSNCKIYQVNRVLAFKGVTVSTRRFKKADYGSKIDINSIITLEGSYKFEDENRIKEMIDQKAIALGASSGEMTTAIITSIAKTLKNKINVNKIDRSTKQALLDQLESKIESWEKTLKIYEGVLDKN